MLGAGELVTAALRIRERSVQRLLGPGRDVQRSVLSSDGSAAELGPQPFKQQRRLESVELAEGSFDQTVGITEQRQEQVFGVELVVAQANQELLDTRQRFSGFVCEFF